jgi:hypothetical protein
LEESIERKDLSSFLVMRKKLKIVISEGDNIKAKTAICKPHCYGDRHFILKEHHPQRLKILEYTNFQRLYC